MTVSVKIIQIAPHSDAPTLVAGIAILFLLLRYFGLNKPSQNRAP
jgi:hypothetical protein